MKFFKVLSIVFPIYVVLDFIAGYFLNSGTALPPTLDTIAQLVGWSLIFLSIPFTSLLNALGMYVTAYWSLPTIGGIILSAIIWEIIFILLFLFMRRLKKRKTQSLSVNFE